MERISRKFDKIWEKVQNIKETKYKKDFLNIGLLMLLIPEFLVMLKFSAEAFVCLLVNNFLMFSIQTAVACVLFLIIVKTLLTVLYLCNIIEK